MFTYASEELKQIPEVQDFQEKIPLFARELNVARFDFDGEVDENRVTTLYDEVLNSHNEMVLYLGFEKEIINVNRF